MSQADSARLILRLYELRRDPTLRAPRDWFVGRFHPTTAQEVFAVWMGPESAYYRMTTTAKMQPFLPELRKRSGLPDYLGHLERVVLSQPNAEARLEVFRRYLAHRATLANTVSTKEVQ